MIKIFSTQLARQSAIQTSQAGFSTYVTEIKVACLEKRVDVQKKKIPLPTDFFPIESLSPQEEEKLDNEGIKIVKTFNKMLRQANEKAAQGHLIFKFTE